MKNLFMFLMLISLFLLGSCDSGTGKMTIFDDSNIKADARMEQVIEIIQNKDEDALKAIFSKQALSDADAFDENLSFLLNYIQGDIQIWESAGAYTAPEENNADGSGNHKKEIQSTYILTTDEQEYEIAIYEYTIDTANPDNVGVYSFCIINSKENEYPDFVYWGNGNAGINIG